ncbi:aspartyl-tRNA(Asn)/glutamyl-tRNA(Gln) amidotransferase subunit A [Litoreibacter meonggei]|uniref:Aspartyl-tRNA(Asn)/glutamyl-tRNA(Gln) amidotransferase subunit A n=1 Tax=Litoreibacter meonggei TaxID=1049199 RepID=A0A497WPL6_9RHOB|nr:amidase family protein [Litoreibacter meonggei]RLJ51899.1 aspartyl-tRNA(Asn)/glutamyl-tRNA(Gln) amidotransferase subunit A [Litoreibacter meonggei]
MSDKWLFMTASDLGRGIDTAEIDPVALTELYLDAARGHEFSDRIYARLTEGRARTEAAAAKVRADMGQRRGLLDGVPISWKDLFDTAGTGTEAGSALLKGRVPDSDAEVLVNASHGGAVCLGKTHMSELAFSGLGLNPVTATSPCVNDVDAVAGGSSSGAATSVAFGLAAAGIGSDTGGSVRIPAAWNDLVGLKTTVGRVSVKGVVPLCARFDSVGPLCRSVEDAAHLLAALEGGKVADINGVSLDGMRLMILESVAFDDIRPEPKAGFESAVERLKAAGAVIERKEAPEVADALALSGTLFAPEAYGIWKDVIDANPSVMFPEILERFRSGSQISGPDYVAGWRKLEALRVIWNERIAGYDAVILPTSPILPPNAERLLTDSEYYVTENLLALRNTRVGNLMGSAGITLPTGLSSTGIMFLGAPNSEERLLRLGAAAEAAFS